MNRRSFIQTVVLAGSNVVGPDHTWARTGVPSIVPIDAPGGPALGQNDLPTYSTAVGLSKLEVPEINYLRTNGYHAEADRGGAVYRLKPSEEPDEQGQIISNDGGKRWGLAIGQEIVPEMFGAIAGETRFDCAPAINDAIAFFDVPRRRPGCLPRRNLLDRPHGDIKIIR